MRWCIHVGRFSLTRASGNGGYEIEARYWECLGNKSISVTMPSFRQALDWILTMKKTLAEKERQTMKRLRIGAIE